MSKRTCYKIKDFPFDKLRVGGANKKGATLSEFNTVHQSTFIETTPGNLEEYAIEWPAMKSGAISYYIDPKQANIMNPSLYIHPILHPKWADLNEHGEVSHTTNEKGLQVEEFIAKYTAAINRECLKIPENDRIWMMGDCPLAETPDEKSVFIEPIANHPKYMATHPKAGRRDVDKPKTIDMALWTQDKTKRKEGDKKKKFSKMNNNASYGGASFTASKSARTEANDAPVTDPVAEDDGDFMIPGTNTIIYTAVYDLTDEKKANTKNKQGEARFGEQAKQYGEIKKYIYNPNGHPNASDKNSDIMSSFKTLGPSINWARNGKAGTCKWKVNELRVILFKERSRERILSGAELAELTDEARSAKADCGFDDDDNEVVTEHDPKEPVFASEFERANYEEQVACRRQLKMLDEQYASLNDQKNDSSLSVQLIKSIEKKMQLIEEKRKKKLQEQRDLEDELAELKADEDNGMDDDEGEREDDSGADQ